MMELKKIKTFHLNKNKHNELWKKKLIKKVFLKLCVANNTCFIWIQLISESSELSFRFPYGFIFWIWESMSMKRVLRKPTPMKIQQKYSIILFKMPPSINKLINPKSKAKNSIKELNIKIFLFWSWKMKTFLVWLKIINEK